ncbi:MAG: GTPase Era [Nitrospinota bacterium]
MSVDDKLTRRHTGFIAISGQPNVGKSTLLNKMVHQKVTITSPRPQTTRNIITAILNNDSTQAIFLDTPGFTNRSKDPLTRKMSKIAVTSTVDADILLFIVDATKPDLELDKLLFKQIATSNKTNILLLNKVDLLKKKEILGLIAIYSKSFPEFKEIVPVSAKTQFNIKKVLSIINNNLPLKDPIYPTDIVTNQPEKFFVGELIREKAIFRLQGEVPYSMAISVHKIEKKSPSLTKIYADIVVERDSQKQIVIGKSGAMIKAIGSAARKELESRLAVKIYLDLQVRTKKNWKQELDNSDYDNKLS